MVYEVQTSDCQGAPVSEYRYQPEPPTDLEESYIPNMNLIRRGEQDKLN